MFCYFCGVCGIDPFQLHSFTLIWIVSSTQFAMRLSFRLQGDSRTGHQGMVTTLFSISLWNGVGKGLSRALFLFKCANFQVSKSQNEGLGKFGSRNTLLYFLFK